MTGVVSAVADHIVPNLPIDYTIIVSLNWVNNAHEMKQYEKTGEQLEPEAMIK